MHMHRCGIDQSGGLGGTLTAFHHQTVATRPLRCEDKDVGPAGCQRAGVHDCTRSQVTRRPARNTQRENRPRTTITKRSSGDAPPAESSGLASTKRKLYSKHTTRLTFQRHARGSQHSTRTPSISPHQRLSSDGVACITAGERHIGFPVSTLRS